MAKIRETLESSGTRVPDSVIFQIYKLKKLDFEETVHLCLDYAVISFDLLIVGISN